MWWRKKRPQEPDQEQLEEQAAYWKARMQQHYRETREERLKGEIAERRMRGERHPLDPRP
jgi:hypothetical protein